MKQEKAGYLMEDLENAILFGKPETVGTAVVWRAAKEESGSSYVVLGLGVEGVFEVFSQYIDGVPEGMFKKGQKVEILVKRERAELFDSIFNLATKRKHNPFGWLVAIRPFSEETYGKPVAKDDIVTRQIFAANFRDRRIAPTFYDKFLKTS